MNFLVQQLTPRGLLFPKLPGPATGRAGAGTAATKVSGRADADPVPGAGSEGSGRDRAFYPPDPQSLFDGA